jgi:hypothetical protein
MGSNEMTREHDTELRRQAEIRGSLGVPASGSGTGITSGNSAFSTRGSGDIG